MASASPVEQDQLPDFSLMAKFQSLVSSVQGLVGAIECATEQYRAVLTGVGTQITGDWVPLDIPVPRIKAPRKLCRAYHLSVIKNEPRRRE